MQGSRRLTLRPRPPKAIERDPPIRAIAAHTAGMRNSAHNPSGRNSASKNLLQGLEKLRQTYCATMALSECLEANQRAADT